jgi:hypothetical protein
MELLTEGKRWRIGREFIRALPRRLINWGWQKTIQELYPDVERLCGPLLPLKPTTMSVARRSMPWN